MNFQKSSVYADTIDSYTFSDLLVPNYELSWELKKSKYTYEGDVSTSMADMFIWELTSLLNLTLGDIFRIKLLEDPDEVITSNYTDYFNYGDSWAEFYVNSNLLGDNASEIDFEDLYLNLDEFPVFLMLPVTIEVEGTEMNYFDYLADKLSCYLTDTKNEKYKITNKKDKFEIEKQTNTDGMAFIGIPFDKDTTRTVVYNTEWGILSRVEYKLSFKQGEDTIDIEILFEILNDEIVIAPFEWVFGVSVLFIAGIITLYRKRKKLQ